MDEIVLLNPEGFSKISPGASADAPEASFALMSGDKLLACCSIWWSRVPVTQVGRPGLVGHYFSASSEAGLRLLNHACTELRAKGCTVVLGPMNGSTWKKYRLVTDPGSDPPFLMEPSNPPDWPVIFEAAGFQRAAGYSSSLASDLTVRDSRLTRVDERLRAEGVSLRTVRLENFREELRAIYQLTLDSFSKAFLYTPIDEAGFLALYEPIRDKIRPEFVLMAEHDGKLAGYIFGVPDLLEAARGETVRTVIAKTAAVRAGRLFAGLGAWMLEHLHDAAHEAGMTRCIHALEHEGNHSRNLSGRYGSVMRRYHLYHRQLDS